MDAKQQGQLDSLASVLDDKVEAFMDLIAAIPSGRHLSVNEVRAHLDRYEIPPKARAGLFAQAVARQLIKPLKVDVLGYQVPISVPSTGPSAHKAMVKVYVRT